MKTTLAFFLSFPLFANAQSTESSLSLQSMGTSSLQSEAEIKSELVAPDNEDDQLIPTYSQFYALPAPGTALVKLGVANGSGAGYRIGERGSFAADSQDYSFQLLLPARKRWHYSVGMDFANRKSPDHRQTQRQGLNDVQVGMVGISEYEEGNAIYGMDVGLSPGARTETNNFSGGAVFTPYWGYEAPMGRMTLGGKLSLLKPTQGAYGRPGETLWFGQADGFLEVPLMSVLDFGIKVGYSHELGSDSKFFRVGSYANVAATKDLDIELEFSSQAAEQSGQSQSQIMAGVRRTL